MFAGLLASARELRFPLTVGYSALLTVWLLFGEPLEAAARNDPLGRRLLAALDSLGSPAELGVITFAAAMIGSVIWNAAVRRLVRFITAKAGHPRWQDLIDEAREAAKSYGEYTVVSTKGQPSGRPASHDERHTVPSTAWTTHLMERVQERERKESEMSFRVTLAISLVPVALAIGIEGGGLWWLGLAVVPIIWLDVALLKHTTLRLVNRYQLEDLQERLRALEDVLVTLNARAIEASTNPAEGPRVQKRIEETQKEADEVRSTIERIHTHSKRRVTRLFEFIEGKSVS